MRPFHRASAKYSFDFCAIATPSGFESGTRGLIARGALGVIVVRGGHRRIARELAVIEPDDVDAAVRPDRDRFPTTIPGRVRAWNDRGGAERLSAIVGSRLPQRRTVFSLRRPDNDDGGLGARAMNQRDLRRLLAVQTRIADRCR